MNDWDPLLERPRLESVRVNDVEMKPGDRVRLHPLGRADIMDMALEGKIATIEAIEQDFEDRVYLGVVVEDDPGRDLGQLRQPGHCFYFGIEEVEPLHVPRILIAGIGNIFFGDDAFGSEVARRLIHHPLPSSVRVVDFGIRGLDLTYALLDPYETVILVDALPRGGPVGTIYVLEPEISTAGPTGAVVDPHSMDPVKVLRMARELGSTIKRVLLVGCEPGPLTSDHDDMQMEMSEPVKGVVAEAIAVIESLVAENLANKSSCTSFPLP